MTDPGNTVSYAKIYQKVVASLKSSGKSRDLKFVRCVIQNILYVTLIAKTFTGCRLKLALILTKSLTVDPYNC